MALYIENVFTRMRVTNIGPDKEWIEGAKKLLIKAIEILDETSEGIGENESDIEEYKKDRVELWCRVLNEGGLAPQERLHEIWND